MSKVFNTTNVIGNNKIKATSLFLCTFLFCNSFFLHTACFSQTTSYIVKGGVDTGSFTGGVFMSLGAKVVYGSSESRILVDEKTGTLETSWKDLIGVAQSATSLTKTANDGWGNAGAVSNSKLDTLKNGWVQYTVENLSNTLAFGLSTTNTDAHYNTINYAVMINSGQLSIYNNGQLIGNYGALALHDSIRISRIGNILFFTKNNQELYNQATDAKQPLMADVSFYKEAESFAFKSSLKKQDESFFFDLACGGAELANTGERELYCEASSSSYNSKYGRFAGYIPIPNITPVKTINISFHFFQKNDGSNNWQNESSYIARLNDIVYLYMNPRMLGLSPPSDPIAGVSHISNSTVQYELTGIYFYQNDNLNTQNAVCNVATPYESYVNSVDPSRIANSIPIYVTAGPICSNTASGFGVFPSEYDLNQNAYVVTGAGKNYAPQGDYAFAGHLVHELGHDLDLNHTYDGAQYILSPDYLSDVYNTVWKNYCNPAPNYTCKHQAGWALNPYDDSNYSTNNIMGGTQENLYLSPLQLGKMNRSLGIKSVRKYVKEMESSPNFWVVDSDETWDFDINMYQDVFVTNGATLTIKCKLNMANMGRIVVDREAQLIIDGGTVTSIWKMWRGIQVHGYYYSSQQVAGEQGKVILKNGAIIENAYEGIVTLKKDNNGNSDWNYTGGIIQAQNATFRNCRKAVAFLSYRNFNPSTNATTNNISYFRNCVFETTQQLNDPNVNLDDHVSLYNVQGIRFLGCDFSNTAPAGANQGVIQNGIKSIDASYTVDNLCLNSNTLPCNNLKQSTFINLNYGIYATNSNPLLKVRVNGAFFEKNRYDGIHLKGMNYPTVSNCSFDVGAYTQLSSGLYLDNCKYYSVQKNSFYTTSTAGGAVGIWANNSKTGAHEIYNNTFTGLAAGIVTLNDNSGMNNTTDGLRMNCNVFTGNAYDIGITGTTANNNSIALVQGTTPGTATDLVRNRYSAPCGGENQFFITGSTKQVIHASNSNANTQPLPQPGCSDVLVQVQPTNIAFQGTHCPDKTTLTNQQRRTLINQLATASLTLKNSYTALVDGGNTQQLLNTVNSNVSAGSLKNTLSNKSPYLSDTVM
ncbi:MAG: right-handed parallel beta-helix repeat-containing protein, partial [Bacteroidia bacterium]